MAKSGTVEKVRQSNFEILRIICILMIIVFHFVFNSEWDPESGFTFSKFTVEVVYHFGEIAVNCFILISGYFLKDTRFSVKKLVLLVLQCEFYLILSRLVAVYTGVAAFSDWGFKDYLFPVVMSQYWFLTCYIIIYMLSPFIKKTVAVVSKKELGAFVVVNFLVWSFFQTVVLGIFYNRSEAENMDNYNRLIWLIVVYVTGAYIREYGLPYFDSLKKRLILFICVAIFIVAHILLAEYNVLNLLPAVYFWNPNTPPVFILSIALFSVFEKIRVPYIKVINFLASCTLGIYMIHERAMADVWWRDIFNTPVLVYSEKLILWLGLAAICVFAVGLTVEVIRKTLERFIIYIFDKGKGVYYEKTEKSA